MVHDPRRDLVSLRNIGPVTARRLHEVQIDDLDALVAAGPAEVYVRVAEAAPGPPSRTLLWALFGALVDLDWRDVPVSEQERLLAEVAAIRGAPRST